MPLRRYYRNQNTRERQSRLGATDGGLAGSTRRDPLVEVANGIRHPGRRRVSREARQS
jgi:hypothetical protein